jgi:hypothetical protein
MRLELKNLHEIGINNAVFDADVGFRRHGGIRFASKPSMQKLLLSVRLDDKLVADHLIMTVGKEIPAVPLTYSRIMPGNKIKFLGNVFKYTRKADRSTDYGIKMLQLLESKQNNSGVIKSDNTNLKDLWLSHKITSKQYLQSLSKGRR